MTKPSSSQGTLFAATADELAPAAPNADDRRLAAELPPGVRFGAMSWTFPGWRGLVYDHDVNVKRLAKAGLPAYAQHPLLQAVEIDRSYYEPLPAPSYRELAGQVPEPFRFVVKAHEECMLRRFPPHARYGKKRGEANPRYLDAAYATDAVVAAVCEGLGAKLGAILFQFPPQDAGGPRQFTDELGAFLMRLPRGVPYAVELRNPELLTARYAAALTASGALHCHNVWGEMPPLLVQAKRIPPEARRPLVVRWLLRRGDNYESARARFEPFDRLSEEDAENREAIARLVAKAAAHDVPALVLVNNTAEGCAPESIARLARAIAERASRRV